MSTVTSKCKNVKRWTQQTKIREENAKKGSAEQMAMREPFGSKSEKRYSAHGRGAGKKQGQQEMKARIKIFGEAKQNKNKMRRTRSDHLDEGEDGERCSSFSRVR